MKLNLTANKIIMALSVVGIAISLYLTYAKLTANPLICGIGDCGAVQNSKYSSILGIPVAVFGVLFYFIMFSLVYYIHKNPQSPLLKKLNLGRNLWILWGVAFSTYLTYLELFVIHAICIWCVASFVVVLLIAAVVVLEWKKYALYKL